MQKINFKNVLQITFIGLLGAVLGTIGTLALIKSRYGIWVKLW